MTNVPLLDLKAQYAQIRAEVMPLIARVCEAQQFILGEHVRGLEDEVARYCGASFGVGVSSGTDALLLALMALGIGAGDEVVTTPFTFFATAGTIARAGARPVFCDIDPATFNLSPLAVQRFIDRECEVRGRRNSSTGGPDGRDQSALMPVHLYGQSADMGPLMEIARRHHLRSSRMRPRPSAPSTKTARAWARSATLAASLFFHPRISAPSAMPGCVRPRMPSSPNGCGCCACTAASPNIFMRSSAGIFASMSCRRRSCA
jgi:hypothetical protein